MNWLRRSWLQALAMALAIFAFSLFIASQIQLSAKRKDIEEETRRQYRRMLWVESIAKESLTPADEWQIEAGHSGPSEAEALRVIFARRKAIAFEDLDSFVQFSYALSDELTGSVDEARQLKNRAREHLQTIDLMLVRLGATASVP